MLYLITVHQEREPLVIMEVIVSFRARQSMRVCEIIDADNKIVRNFPQKRRIIFQVFWHIDILYLKHQVVYQKSCRETTP